MSPRTLTPIELTLQELRHRWLSTLALMLVFAVAVALVLGIEWIGQAAAKETRRVQRDLGFNLRILPESADPNEFLLRGYTTSTMDLKVVHTLAERKTVSYNHLVATLQQPKSLQDLTVIFTGVSETMFPPGKKKPPMSPTIPAGKTRVGFAVAAATGWHAGQQIELMGKPFEVIQVVAETGGVDDLRVWLSLEDAQKLLSMPGQISEIRAIDCLCLDPEDNPKLQLKQEIESVAPGTQVMMMQTIATARSRQRRMIDGVTEQSVPVIMGCCGLCVLAFSVYNVRQRFQEFAVLGAMGRSPGTIGLMVILRTLICALSGAAIGGAVALFACRVAIPELFPVTGKKFLATWLDFWWVATTMLLIAAAASIAPIAYAHSQDVAKLLRSE